MTRYPMLCLHCHARKPTRGHRGLCRPCFEDKGVRARYPRRPPGTPENNETMEELEALIAGQRQCLPAWWHSETEPEVEAPVEIRVFRVRTRGRGRELEAIS